MAAISGIACLLAGSVALAQPSNSPAYVFGPFIGPPGLPGIPSTAFGAQTLDLHAAGGAEFVLQATAMGAYYSSNGGEGPPIGAYHYAANTNYLAASCASYGCNTLLGPEENARNFFVFDLSGVSGRIDSAVLSIGNGPSGASPFPVHYSVWDVTTSTADLEASHPWGGAGLAIYYDLGSGIPYGGADLGPADDGSQILIQLGPLALDSLNTAEGGSWALGGSVVPEPASWAMMLVGFGGLGVAMRSRRKQGSAAA
jgi:hypothetical protein